jgi:hypothetical protein
MHKRIETNDDVTIIFKYYPLFYLCFIGLLISEFFPPTIGGIISIAITLLFSIYILGNIKVWFEIRKAMKVGDVKISGSKFSFSNPLTFVIKKQQK